MEAMQASRQRIPGPAGAVLAAQRNGLRLQNFDNDASSQGNVRGLQMQALATATEDRAFWTGTWERALTILGVSSFDGKLLRDLQFRLLVHCCCSHPKL